MPQRLAITGPHQLEILDYADAPLAAGQVRVRTEFASGKHGTNLGMFDGRSFAGKVFDQSMRLFVDAEPSAEANAAPRNSGTTGVGVIEAVGPDVEQWQPGDRVFGPMDIRETNICRADRVWKLGDVPPALALCIEPAYVAFHAVREAQVRFGDTVAVIGLGVLGLLAVRMARLSGAARIVAVDMHENRLNLAQACGADVVFPAQRATPNHDVAAYDVAAYDVAAYDVAVEIHRATENAGVDVAIELAGSYPALQTAIRAARVGGTVCAAGFYQGDAQGIWLGREWHHNRLNMIVPHGCGWGHPPRDFPRWDETRAYATLAAMMQSGKLTAPDLIAPWVDFDAATHIFEEVAQHPETSIKFGVRFPSA